MSDNHNEVDLKNWNCEACVRTRPHKYEIPAGLTEFTVLEDWYPRSRLPFLLHPEFREKSQNLIQRLLAEHLIYFMEYTTTLEHRIVNRAVQTLVHQDLGFKIPARMKISALQLYTDEGYHALVSYELSTRVRSIYKISSNGRDPQRIIDLEALIENETPSRRNILSILIAFVSETIIAKELATLSKQALVPAVYEILRDHLDDEAKHSKLFSYIFLYIWRRSTAADQEYIVTSVKQILAIFFATDEVWLSQTLLSCEINSQTIDEIMRNLRRHENISQRIVENAVATLHTLKKAGIDLMYN